MNAILSSYLFAAYQKNKGQRTEEIKKRTKLSLHNAPNMLLSLKRPAMLAGVDL